MFNIQFPFKVRMAMEVADSVAEHLCRLHFAEEGYVSRRDRNYYAAISIKEMADGAIKFHYEGGTVVLVYLVNPYEEERWRQTGEAWEVLRVSCRVGAGDQKSEVVFGPLELVEIRNSRCGWYHPHVSGIDDTPPPPEQELRCQPGNLYGCLRNLFGGRAVWRTPGHKEIVHFYGEKGE